MSILSLLYCTKIAKCWSFCGYGSITFADIRTLACFGVLCKLRHYKGYADGEGLRFLRICADFLVLEFLQTYT